MEITYDEYGKRESKLKGKYEEIGRKIAEINKKLLEQKGIIGLGGGDSEKAIEELIQEGNKERRSFIEFYIKDKVATVFVSLPSGMGTYELEIGASEIMEKAQHIIGSISRRPDNDRPSEALKSDLKSLYEALFSKIDQKLQENSIKRIVIIPSRNLYYLPFGALMDREGKYLVERYQISYLPSISTAKYLKEKDVPLSLLAIANPITSEADLPGAQKEAEEVARKFHKNYLFVRESATKEKFFRHAPEVSTILLSTHGILDHQNVWDSRIYFSEKGAPEGSHLLLGELPSLQTDANLAYLSACETGAVEKFTGKANLSLCKEEYEDIVDDIMSLAYGPWPTAFFMRELPRSFQLCGWWTTAARRN